MNCSLNSLQGAEPYIGEYDRGSSGDTRSLDYARMMGNIPVSFKSLLECRIWGLRFVV